MKLLLARVPQAIRVVIKSASKYARQKVPASFTTNQHVPVYARATPRQPIHPSALLRQSKRWASSHARLVQAFRYISFTTGQNGSGRLAGNVASSIRRTTGRVPFATTLRPSLTGGALPRSAGGYSLGSGNAKGARYFSHTPEAPAQVIQSVSQAMRAFANSGRKIQYCGTDRRTGEKRYKGVSELQDKATKKMNSVPKATPGSFIDFSVNPTITALTPLSSVVGYKAPSMAMETLHTEGLLDILSTDFSLALKELTLVMADLKALSSLGDLPISYQNTRLRVHFPGCDPETVGRLADEFRLQRGMVGQDPEFDDYVGTEIALLFPFAPSDASPHSSPNLGYDQQEYRYSSPTTLSNTSIACDDFEDMSNSWSSPSEFVQSNGPRDSEVRSRGFDRQVPFEHQDFEGIYRFIELCDNSRR